MKNLKFQYVTFSLLVIFCLSLLMTSCEKGEVIETVATETSTLEDNAKLLQTLVNHAETYQTKNRELQLTINRSELSEEVQAKLRATKNFTIDSPMKLNLPTDCSMTEQLGRFKGCTAYVGGSGGIDVYINDEYIGNFDVVIIC